MKSRLWEHAVVIGVYMNISINLNIMGDTDSCNEVIVITKVTEWV